MENKPVIIRRLLLGASAIKRMSPKTKLNYIKEWQRSFWKAFKGRFPKLRRSCRPYLISFRTRLIDFKEMKSGIELILWAMRELKIFPSGNMKFGYSQIKVRSAKKQKTIILLDSDNVQQRNILHKV